jgi:hypothetical protein
LPERGWKYRHYFGTKMRLSYKPSICQQFRWFANCMNSDSYLCSFSGLLDRCRIPDPRPDCEHCRLRLRICYWLSFCANFHFRNFSISHIGTCHDDTANWISSSHSFFYLFMLISGTNSRKTIIHHKK